MGKCVLNGIASARATSNLVTSLSILLSLNMSAKAHSVIPECTEITERKEITERTEITSKAAAQIYAKASFAKERRNCATIGRTSKRLGARARHGRVLQEADVPCVLNVNGAADDVHDLESDPVPQRALLRSGFCPGAE